MTIPFILGHGVFLYSLLHAGFSRPGARTRAEDRRKRAPAIPPGSEPLARTPLERLPDQISRAGIPLRVLLSEHSGSGGLLRETLLTRPPSSKQ